MESLVELTPMKNRVPRQTTTIAKRAIIIRLLTVSTSLEFPRINLYKHGPAKAIELREQKPMKVEVPHYGQKSPFCQEPPGEQVSFRT